MSTFTLPDLYMPYPGRLNPQVDAARAHARAWAIEMGMVDGHAAFTWTLDEFESYEFALLCCYTQPDLSLVELELMVDWYVWLFFFDDYYVEAFKRTDDYAGGQGFLARLWRFLPLAGEPTPAPINPVERGMAELWARTVVDTREAWRRRYVAHVVDMLETALWEHHNIRHARVANPLEYVAMRRMVGGCVWAACLVERARRLDLSDELLAARPVRLIHEAFADCEHLHNDLMSYSREVRHEGEHANIVLVLERFCGFDTQQAANLANDLLTSRLHQLEFTLAVELPEHCEQQGVSTQQRHDLHRYAEGVLAWLAGAYEWHFHSRRYDLARATALVGCHGDPTYLGPTGLSPAAAGLLSDAGFRTHACTTRLAPLALATPSGGVSGAFVHARAWARSMGMFDEGVWIDEPLARPRDLAIDARLALALDWTTWLAYLDDVADATCGARAERRAAEALAARVCRGCFDAPASGEDALARGLQSLWLRSRALVGERWCTEVGERLRARGESYAWAADAVRHGRAPDLIDYFEMRRRGELALELAELIGAPELPGALAGDRFVVQLREAFLDAQIVRRELRRRPGLDLVMVVEALLGGERDAALAFAARLGVARHAQFRALAQQLPGLGREYEQVGAWAAALEEGFERDVDQALALPRRARCEAEARPYDHARAYLERTRVVFDRMGASPTHPHVAMLERVRGELARRARAC